MSKRSCNTEPGRINMASRGPTVNARLVRPQIRFTAVKNALRSGQFIGSLLYVQRHPSRKNTFQSSKSDTWLVDFVDNLRYRPIFYHESDKNYDSRKGRPLRICIKQHNRVTFITRRDLAVYSHDWFVNSQLLIKMESEGKEGSRLFAGKPSSFFFHPFLALYECLNAVRNVSLVFLFWVQVKN